MPFQLPHTRDDGNNARPPLKHPADDLYTYTLCAEIPPPMVEPRHDYMQPLGYELSVQPDSLIRLKTLKAISMVYFSLQCTDFVRRRIPKTPIKQPRNPNVDDRPTTFFVNCPGFEGKARRTGPITTNQEMVDWTMGILETVETVMTLRFSRARDIKFSQIADEEMQDPAVDEDLYVPLYYKKRESHTIRVTEPLVKLVVAQLAPWSLSHSDIRDLTKFSEFPSCYVGSDGQVHSPDSLNRVQKIWARLWLDCARVNCPFFIITTGRTWILGAFYSGRTQAIHFQLSYRRDNVPSLFQWLIFWCASALNIRGSWSPPSPDTEFPHSDVHGSPDQFQLEKFDMGFLGNQTWIDAHVEHSEDCKTEQVDDKIWSTFV